MQSDCSLSNGTESTSENSSIQIQMKTIIGEFKKVYQQKLKALDDDENSISLQQPESYSILNEKLRLKVKTLESYVKDVLEQNDVLVQTIDELEREANCRVVKLEDRIQKLSTWSKVNIPCNRFCQKYNYLIFFIFQELSLSKKELEKSFHSLCHDKISIERELRVSN